VLLEQLHVLRQVLALVAQRGGAHAQRVDARRAELGRDAQHLAALVVDRAGDLRAQLLRLLLARAEPLYARDRPTTVPVERRSESQGLRGVSRRVAGQ
jgi:hypothetical protein